MWGWDSNGTTIACDVHIEMVWPARMIGASATGRRTATRPRVSIGLPVHNGGRFVAEALESILAQTYTDFEVIISDNASADQTMRICQAYAAADKRISYSRTDSNLGAARNFNRVFRLSRGEYFKWAAADDVLEPTFLERCVQVLDEDPTVALAYTRVTNLDERNVVREGTFHYHLADLRTPAAYDRFRQMFLHASVYPVFGLIRSGVLKRTRLFRAHIGADDCLLVDLVLRCQRDHQELHEVTIRETHQGRYDMVRSAAREDRFL